MKIYKAKIKHWTEEAACEYCGAPVTTDEPSHYEIENLEHLVFCSKVCAQDYIHNAEY